MLRRRMFGLAMAATVAALGVTAARAEPTGIKVALGWLRNGQYAPLMVADAKGYFAEEGLKVSFLDGGPGKNPVPIVGVGQADFGVIGAANVFLARLAPDPVDVVAIGALAQKRPYAYITLADPSAPEPTPKDLEGKTVGMQSDGGMFLEAIVEKNGLDASKIATQTVLATAEPLLVGKVDYFTGMLHNQTYQIEQEIAKAPAGSPLAGKVWKAIRFDDYGQQAYHDVLFTSKAMIDGKPQLVAAFLRAVAKGLAFTIAEPDESVKLVAAYPEQIEDPGKLAWRLKIQNPLAISADTAAHGLLWMNPATWDANMAFYRQYGQIPRVVPAAEVMTNAFNPEIKSAAAQ